MTLRRIGKYFYIDLRVRGVKKRIRRALHTSDKIDALDKYKEEKERILAEYMRKDLKLEDFAKKYLDWAWSSKPASADREKQRIDKIKGFFKSLGIEYLAQITPYHIEQLKAKLGETGFSPKPKKPRPATQKRRIYFRYSKPPAARSHETDLRSDRETDRDRLPPSSIEALFCDIADREGRVSDNRGRDPWP